MVTATFRVELPPTTWIRDLSLSVPDVEFRLLSGMPTAEGSVELGEIDAKDAASSAPAVADRLAGLDPIVEYETLYADEERVLSRYATAEPSLYEFLRTAGAPPEFPIVVADGRFEVDLTGPREQLAGVESHLAASGLDFEVRSIVERPEPGAVLTERQRELLTTAFRRGYYEVPRDCTLGELADAVGIDTSTASGVLRRAEQSVVAWFLADAEPATGGPYG